MTTWFTSDFHFRHANIIRFSNRPFANVDEMDEALIVNYNSLVQPDDDVYILGDFCLGRPQDAVNIARRLAGNKMLVFGNHDKRLRNHQPFLDQFAWAKDYAEIDVEGQKIVLLHFALRVWNKSHYQSFSLYGHSHGSLKDDPKSLSMDVGVDPNNYFPVSFDQVKIHMSKKTWESIDHHKNYREEG